MEFAEYIQTMPWQLFHMAHNGKFMIDQKEERRHWGGGYILQLSIFCIAIAYFVYLHWHCLCFMVNTDDVSRFYCLVTHSLSLILCKGKVNITIEILVNPKAAFKLAIGVSHMFAINVIDPWEETTMLLSWELVLKIFFLVSLTIHIVTMSCRKCSEIAVREGHLISEKIGVDRVVVGVLYSPAILQKYFKFK